MKRLKKARKKNILGVCGGLGEYWEIDPVWIRLVWLLLTLAFGIGIGLYIVMFLVMPEE